MKEEAIEVAICYKDNYLESLSLEKRHLPSLREELLDEESSTFSVNGKLFRKNEIASVNVGGDFAVQFYTECFWG